MIVTETKLAFSRPWTEAIDVRIPAMKMSVFTSFVEADGGNRATPILTDATLCTVDPQRCHLGASSLAFFVWFGRLVTYPAHPIH